MTQKKAYIVVWHMKNKPEVQGHSHLLDDREFAQHRATMGDQDYPALVHWVEEVDTLNWHHVPTAVRVAQPSQRSSQSFR